MSYHFHINYMRMLSLTCIFKHAHKILLHKNNKFLWRQKKTSSFFDGGAVDLTQLVKQGQYKFSLRFPCVYLVSVSYLFPSSLSTLNTPFSLHISRQRKCVCMWFVESFVVPVEISFFCESSIKKRQKHYMASLYAPYLLHV